MLALAYIPAAGATKSVLLFKSGGGGQYLKALAQNGDDPRDVEDGPSPQQTLEVPSGEPLRRWGTTNSEISHREWPSRRLSIASEDGGTTYRERVRRDSDSRSRSRSPVAEKIRRPIPLLEAISDSDEGDRVQDAPVGFSMGERRLTISGRRPVPSSRQHQLRDSEKPSPPLSDREAPSLSPCQRGNIRGPESPGQPIRQCHDRKAADEFPSRRKRRESLTWL